MGVERAAGRDAELDHAGAFDPRPLATYLKRDERYTKGLMSELQYLRNVDFGLANPSPLDPFLAAGVDTHLRDWYYTPEEGEVQTWTARDGLRLMAGDMPRFVRSSDCPAHMSEAWLWLVRTFLPKMSMTNEECQALYAVDSQLAAELLEGLRGRGFDAASAKTLRKLVSAGRWLINNGAADP